MTRVLSDKEMKGTCWRVIVQKSIHNDEESRTVGLNPLRKLTPPPQKGVVRKLGE